MKRTQKELKPQIKKDVDAFVAEMAEKYPEILHSSLIKYISNEIEYAFDELTYEGKILTNRERWG